MEGRKNFLQKIGETLSSRISIGRDPQIGINMAFVFTDDLSSEAWEKIISKSNPNTLAFIKRITSQAVGMTPEERNHYIESLGSGGSSLLIAPNARKIRDRERKLTQMAINISSMSETNLQNLATALGISTKK